MQTEYTPTESITNETPQVARKQRPEIKPRRLNLEFTDADPKYWYGGEPSTTHLMHALSSVFPEGEAFFVDSVKNYAAKIEEPRLKREIAGFMGQEALHSREHEFYNERMARQNLSLAWVDRWLRRGLGLLRKVAPRKSQLAVTCALEHFTAILANRLLIDEKLQGNMHPTHRALWTWHAVEEIEHKAVAYDVYRTVGGGYFRRVTTMMATTVVFLAAIAGIHFYLMAKDGQLFNLKTWFNFGKWALVSPGAFIKVIPDYLDYYRPSFHPWQHDNQALISDWAASPEAALAVTA